jgi:hypothetical protein
MVKRVIFSFLLVSGFTGLKSQEIATFVSYNLLNYRNETSYCTNTNNSPISKENYFKTIFSYLQPDLLACNEVGANPTNAVKILDRCLNVDGETKYEMANFSSTSGSSLANAFYYNKNMFTMYSYDKVEDEVGGQQIVRLINVYTLYYNNTNLPLGADTTFLTVFIAHFKAGNTSSDKADRTEAAKAVMQYIEDEAITGNYIISGDFNTYTSTEGAIQNLINPTNSAIKFVDPVNRMGAWNNNSSYADVHTQSTHFTSNGCASGGGLDDRFDFILMSQSVKDDLNYMDYVSNSYKAVANDGNHFNQSINQGTNTSVPANVLDAIYNGSDHLPVIMDMIISEAAPNGVSDLGRMNLNIQLVNPSSNSLKGSFIGSSGMYTVNVYSVTGVKVTSFTINNTGNTKFEHALNAKGILFVEVINEAGYKKVIKVIQN